MENPDKPERPYQWSPTDETYVTLKRLAQVVRRDDRSAQPIDATVLVHDAFDRLAKKDRDEWQSRTHFNAAACQAMRQILVDNARRRSAAKRGGGAEQVTIAGLYAEAKDVEVLDLDGALQELAALDPRQARIVELKFFGGLEMEEIAQQLGLSKSVIEVEWRHARAWLRKRLGG